jgi:two-component system sensor histidine kinase UhpB
LNTSKEQLRKLLASVQAEHEVEKGRFARTLHDDLSQKLTALLIELSLLEAALPVNSTEAQKVASLSEIVSSVSQSVRRLTNDLRLKILDEFGLVAALRHESQRFVKEHGVHINIWPEELKVGIDCDAAATIFRIFRQVVARMITLHAANQIEVQIDQRPREVVVRIGEHSGQRRRKKLFSDEPLVLLGLREEVRRFGGTLKLVEIAGAGTVITIQVPNGKKSRSDRKCKPRTVGR